MVSSFDLKSRFWQFKIHPEHRAKTAFLVPQGLYQWKVMPFGLSPDPSLCQQRIDRIFLPIENFCICYIDDILIFSKTPQEHLQHLNQFLDLVEKFGLNLSLTKYRLFESQVNFLGVIISDGKVTSQEHVLKKILEHNTPFANLQQLQQFLGALNWINWQIPNLAQLTLSLTELLKKESTTWTTAHTKAVEKIKEVIQELPILDIIDPLLPICIYTDASQDAWVGVLCNKVQEHIKVCRFVSGKFKPAQRNYPSAHRELLAIKKSIEALQVFLIGQKFHVYSDLNNAAAYLTSKNGERIGNGRLLRWGQWFSHWDCTIVHVKGKENALADALSRLPTYSLKA